VALIIFTDASGYAIEISGLVPYEISDTERKQLELVEEKINIQIVPGQNTRSCYEMTQDYTIKNNGNIDCNIQMGIFVTDAYDPSPVPEDLQFFVNGIEYKYTIIPHEAIYRESVNRIIINVNFSIKSEKVVRIQYTNTRDISPGGSKILCKKSPHYDLSKYYTDWNGTPIFSVAIGNYALGDYNFEDQWISGIRLFQKAGKENIEQSEMCYLLMNMSIPENDLFVIKKNNENTWEIQFTEHFTRQYERAFYIFVSTWGGEIDAYCYLWSRMWNWEGENILQLALFALIYRDDAASIISERKLAPYELIFLTSKQLRIMKNAFYARHGYIFKDEKLRSLFLEYANYGFKYLENPNFSESMLTEIDRANIATIQRLEAMEYGF
jgi:hypothetical protein